MQNRYSYLNTIIMLLLSIIILLLTNFLNHSLYSIGLLAVFSYTIFLTTWFIRYRVKLNFYTIFLLLTFMFYFGQFALLLINVPMNSGRTILDNRIPLQQLIETGVYIINSLTILQLGVFIATRNISKYDVEIEKIQNMEYLNTSKLMNVKRIATIALALSLTPSLSIILENIYITMTQGYGAIFQSAHYTQGGINNIRRFLSLFTIPAFLLTLISYQNDKKLKMIQIIFGIYLFLYFLSGSRMSGVMLLLILVLIVHYWYEPIKLKTGLIYSALSLMLVMIVATISAIRNELYHQQNGMQMIKETVFYIWSSNPLYKILEEAGFTFLTTATVYTYSPSTIPFQYGMSYLNGILMLFPNIFWEVHPAAAVNTDIIFSRFLTNYGGIGSSFIAEAYWNFGNFSLVFMLFFGILIGFITKSIAKYSFNGDGVRFFLSIYLGWIVLTYVRSDTISIWRNFVYYGFSLIVIAHLMNMIPHNKVKSKTRTELK